MQHKTVRLVASAARRASAARWAVMLVVACTSSVDSEHLCSGSACASEDGDSGADSDDAGDPGADGDSDGDSGGDAADEDPLVCEGVVCTAPSPACSDATPQTTCQGQREVAGCLAGQCVTEPVADDSGCAGLAHACPNNFASVSCTDAVDQAPPQCAVACSLNTDCAPGYVCAAPSCVLPAGAGSSCTGSGQGSCNAGLRCENAVCCSALGPPCCLDDADCAGGLRCDTSSFTCIVSCNDDDDSACADPAQICANDTCVPRRTNGATCTSNAQCTSAHCQNGRCCSSGDCCSAPGDCPSSYSGASVCAVTGAATTCQGARLAATCTANTCASSPTDDDSGCLGQARSCPGSTPITCSGASSQPPPVCGPPGPSILWEAPYLGANTLLHEGRALRVDWAGDIVRAQVPGHPDYFVGRELYVEHPSTQSCGHYRLVLKRMNWTTRAMTRVGTLFQANPQCNASACESCVGFALADGNLVGGSLGAYDPTIVEADGELWVAFECVHQGLMWQGQPQYYSAPLYSTCMGRLDVSSGIENAQVAADSTFVAVIGLSNLAGESNFYSGSVPKLLAFGGAHYLYWTAVQYRLGGAGAEWINLTVRGVELQHEPTYGLLAPVHADGTTGAVYSRSLDTYEVLGLVGADATANAVADAFQVTTDGTSVYVTAALGGGDCRDPYTGQSSTGCYRPAIIRSALPLGEHVFNAPPLGAAEHLPVAGLPANPWDYGYFVRDPAGSWFLMGRLENPVGPLLVPANEHGVLPFNLVYDPATATSTGPSKNGTVFLWPLTP